jgi:dolichol-phosphate mannosyltransferase
MRTVIVIPTFNEVVSTAVLIAQLQDLVRREFKFEIDVLYVDGDSTDGTREIIEHSAARLPWLHSITQSKKEGLGAAYAEGIEYAIRKLDADFILEFDGDLQHRVQDIPQLLRKAEEGFDYVIGSRFVRGGSIPANWDVRRVFLSRFGNFVARKLLALPSLTDITSGFKLSRVRGFLDQFDFVTLLSRRHAYKIHLLHFMVQRGARIAEVPIVFEPRTTGESKLVKNDIFDTLSVIFSLRALQPTPQALPGLPVPANSDEAIDLIAQEAK